MPHLSRKLNHHLFVHTSLKLIRNSTCKRTKLFWTLILVSCYCDCFLKIAAFGYMHTEKNWNLSSVVRNINSQIVNLNKIPEKQFLKTLGFIERPIAYTKYICHDAVFTSPCDLVTKKWKRKKNSYFCVRPINNNSLFFMYYPINLI